MLKTIIRFKNGFVRLLEITVIVLVAVLVLDVLWGVVTRSSGDFVQWLDGKGIVAWGFLPRGQSKWTEEIAVDLLMWVSLLSAAVAFGSRSHLGLDYFVGKLHPSSRQLVEFLINVFVAAFAVSVMVAGGYALVSKTLQSGQLTPTLQIKQGYVYLPVPISGIFISLFCTERIIEIFGAGNQETDLSTMES